MSTTLQRIPNFTPCPWSPRSALSVLAALLWLALVPAAQRPQVPARGAAEAAAKAAPPPVRGSNCLSRLNLTESGHSMSNSYLLALVCHYMYPHAYTRNPKGNFSTFESLAKPVFESWGMQKVELREVNNVQYAVMSNRDVVIVAFRGSDEIGGDETVEDWIVANANAFQRLTNLWGTILDGGKMKQPGVHTGYYNAYVAVREEINQRIHDHDGKSKKLFITGHSLGGALAVLCAIDQGYAVRPESRRFVAQGVYTYGGPRVGNALFARLYAEKLSAGGAKALNTHRYVNESDIVAMLPGDMPIHDAYVPLTLYGLGEPHENVKYRHVGRTCNIRKNGKIVRDDSEFRGIGDLLAHHSKRYANRIYTAHVAPQDWASEMPAPPEFPKTVSAH